MRKFRRKVYDSRKIVEEIQQLSIEEREKLLAIIQQGLKRPKLHSLLELEGLGAELWEGIDAQEYVNQLRSEWDHRP
jgi:hypothetical protein